MAWQKKLEVATNISIILLCTLVIGTLGMRMFGRAEARQQTLKAPEVGAKVDLPMANWGSQQKTIVLALSTQCRYCSASAPFYQRLTKQAEERHSRLVAVLPQSQSEAQAYFKSLNIPMREIYNSSLAALKVSGTPTVLVVDSQGKVVKAWVGQLQGAQEREVLAEL